MAERREGERAMSRPAAGAALGVLLLEGRMAEVPGCLACEASFPYPVVHRVVAGSRPPRQLEDVAALRPLYVAAARDLAGQGVAAITDNCNGRLVLLQRALAEAVAVPVVTSALLLVPSLARLLPGRRIGILAFDERDVGDWHYQACGFSSTEVPLAVAGVAASGAWRSFLATKEAPLARLRQMEADLVAAAGGLHRLHPDLGALVVECTLLPPAAQAVRDALGLPVYDILSLVDAVMAGRGRLLS